MLDLLTRAHQVSALTGGAFDITYASVGRYYDYRKGELPDEATIEKAVRARILAGDLSGEEMLDARITLDLPDADLRYEQEGTIALS